LSTKRPTDGLIRYSTVERNKHTQTYSFSYLHYPLHTSYYFTLFISYTTCQLPSQSQATTMNFDDSFAKRRPVLVLTRENCDQWFTLMKRLLIGEDYGLSSKPQRSTHLPVAPPFL